MQVQYDMISQGQPYQCGKQHKPWIQTQQREHQEGKYVLRSSYTPHIGSDKTRWPAEERKGLSRGSFFQFYVWHLKC